MKSTGATKKRKPPKRAEDVVFDTLTKLITVRGKRMTQLEVALRAVRAKAASDPGTQQKLDQILAITGYYDPARQEEKGGVIAVRQPLSRAEWLEAYGMAKLTRNPLAGIPRAEEFAREFYEKEHKKAARKIEAKDEDPTGN